jgi:tryptophanyl-tRNA synthetase
MGAAPVIPLSNHLPLQLTVMTEDTLTPPRPRVLSGMRPTGRLHLGNYMGALYNWVQLQHQYECYFFIADYHALTTEYADPSRLKQDVYEIALDFLAGGLDPCQATIFVQSHVPQHAELNLIFSMFTPISWLERVPTYKDQQEQLREKDLATYGFLGYPLLQSADILLYQPDFVPVGQDQVAHVELTREVAGRFNHLYAGNVEGGSIAKYPGTICPPILSGILPEPQVLLTPSPKLPGTDGRKMSKSYGNSILMTDPLPILMQKAQSMSNGGQRPTQYDPGDPEICPVGDLHRVFSTPEVDAHIRKGCTTATIRCDECKHLVGLSIARHTQPIFNRRMELEANPDRIWDVLDEGAARASVRAEQTMQEVRAVTGLSRDRSGVRVARFAAGYEAAKDVRNLEEFKAWWNLAPALLIRNLREHWRRGIVPVDAALKQDTEGVWLTRNNRRVFVTAAVQNDSDKAWIFSVKPKSYEILVLLCWDDKFLIHDFVIPQKLYLSQWIVAKKRAEKEKKEMVFSVVKENERYNLHLGPNPADRIDITDTTEGYGIIGN